MFLHLQGVLTSEEVTLCQTLLGPDAPWVDGASSAGGQAVHRKNNEQLSQSSDTSRQLQALIKGALQRNPLFFSAALPKRFFNPLFNRYGGDSNYYGNHIDSSMLYSTADKQWVRGDLSCTVFLTDPADYDGGELTITETGGQTQKIKLPAGDAILYPSSTVHQVLPVTRGHRVSSIMWIESMIRSLEQRKMLYDMDMSLLTLRRDFGEQHPSLTALTGTYHNLLRMWGDV